MSRSRFIGRMGRWGPAGLQVAGTGATPPVLEQPSISDTSRSAGFGGFGSNSSSSSESSERLRKHTQAALEQSLTSGVFIDTCFLLFTQRQHNRTRIGVQVPIYAHSQTLSQASDYFQSLLLGGFAEGHVPSPSQQTVQQSIPIDEYGYDSDSDLEDEDEAVPDVKSASELEAQEVVTSGPDEFTKENGSPVIVEREPQSIDDIQREVDDRNAQHPAPFKVTVPVQHLVVIKDSAFRTFKALVYYVYTGDINFSPLRSLTGKAKKKSTMPLSCSPKSMYRLADKYGMADLKKVALDNLKSQLTTGVILMELFSQFTSRYPEVIAIETDFVLAHRKDSACFQDLQEWIDMAVRGEIPHASAALVSLLRKLAAQ